MNRAPLPSKYFIQYSSLFDSIDWHKVEGGYYTILTTTHKKDVWEAIEKMKEKMVKFNDCHGRCDARIFISRFKDDETLEVLYNDDPFAEPPNKDETLEKVSETIPVKTIEDYISYCETANLSSLDDSEYFP